jgi:hypothetical protein
MAPRGSVDQSDLKKVKGIGLKVEARLKAAGIATIGQLARTPVNELAAILDELTGNFDADRIIREEWLSQAAALATVLAADMGEAEPLTRIRHNFTVEVQSASAGRDIVSSRIVHVQTGDEATWAGWDRQRVVAFIEDRAGVRPAATAVEPERAVPAETVPAETEPEPDAARSGWLGEPELPLHTFGIVAATGPEVTAGRAITATVRFDAAALALPADRAARAKVDIYARRLSPGASILLGNAEAVFSPGEEVLIQIPCQLPPSGQSQGLFAAVQLFAASEPGRTPSGVLPDARMTLS